MVVSRRRTGDAIMIGVAVCTRNRPQHLAQWVDHMLHHVIESALHNIIIVDQSDIPQQRTWPHHITYIHSTTRGIAHARNIALHHCTTPYLLFTDDDCRPAADWLICAHACITNDPSVALWFGQTHPHGSNYTLHHYPTNAGHLTWAMRADGMRCHALRIDDLPFRTTQPIAILERLGHGNHMLIQRDSARNIGGFHPWLGAGAWLGSGEDVDFAMRLLTHGHACAYTPALHIVHDAWITPEAHAQIDPRYTTGMIAVHILHAWRGNSVAYNYLVFRWSQARQTQMTPTALSAHIPVLRRIIAIVHGILGGICLIISAYWRRAL